MDLLNNELYIEDVEKVASLPFSWKMLQDANILITGATGMIGSFLIDVLMRKNTELHCKIYAFGRNIEKAKQRFETYFNSPCFQFIVGDINSGISLDVENIDYIIHAASNTHPVAYATDPIGTVLTNVVGTNNLLEFATSHKNKRFVFTSSVEVYGENRGDISLFQENYCGYIDCNTLRAGYPESKRAGEALCQAYIKQKGLDIVIPRLARTYGPTMLDSDTKAISQFIKKGVAEENIILKSKGNQLYSYCYVADSVSGILAILFNGKCGEAYNIADISSDITLKELAGIIADYVNKQVVFELPDATESAGYSKATVAVMDSSKIKKINWIPFYEIHDGLQRTIDILRSLH